MPRCKMVHQTLHSRKFIRSDEAAAAMVALGTARNRPLHHPIGARVESRVKHAGVAVDLLRQADEQLAGGVAGARVAALVEGLRVTDQLRRVAGAPRGEVLPQGALERERCEVSPKDTSWPMHAFLWKYSYKRLKLAQLLGQLGVCLTWA